MRLTQDSCTIIILCSDFVFKQQKINKINTYKNKMNVKTNIRCQVVQIINNHDF